MVVLERDPECTAAPHPTPGCPLLGFQLVIDGELFP